MRQRRSRRPLVEELIAALQALVATARTFRGVPNEEHHWGPLDDEALEAAFRALNRARKERGDTH